MSSIFSFFVCIDGAVLKNDSFFTSFLFLLFSQIEIRELRGLPLVANAVVERDVDIVRYALRLICNLCFDDDNKAEFVELGVVEPLLELTDNDDADLRMHSLLALANICAIEAGRIEVREKGGVSLLVSNCGSSNLRIRRAAVKAIGQLLYDGDAVSVAREEGVIGSLVICLRSADEESQR